jgi:hypothetical protein
MNCGQWPYPCDGGLHFVSGPAGALLIVIFIGGFVVFGLSDNEKLTQRQRDIASGAGMLMMVGPGLLDVGVGLLGWLLKNF